MLSFNNLQLRQDEGSIDLPEWAKWLINFGYQFDDVDSSVLMVLPARDYAALLISFGLMLRRLVKTEEAIGNDWLNKLSCGDDVTGVLENPGRGEEASFLENGKDYNGEYFSYVWRRRNKRAKCKMYLRDGRLSKIYKNYVSSLWGGNLPVSDTNSGIFGIDGFLVPPEIGNLILCASAYTHYDRDVSLNLENPDHSVNVASAVLSKQHNERDQGSCFVKKISRCSDDEEWKKRVNNNAEGCNVIIANGKDYFDLFTNSSYMLDGKKFLLILSRTELLDLNFTGDFNGFLGRKGSGISVPECSEKGIFCYGVKKPEAV